MLIIDDSCEEICNSKAFVDIATAGRHRGLSTIYIIHNPFHQSKLGRDFELQNTHIVLFKSPRDLMLVATLGARLGLSSELVDWYRGAMSVPFGLLLNNLSPRTDDRLRYCTNSGSVPSNFYIPERLKHLRTFNDEHTKSLYSPSVPIAFRQMQKPLSSVLPKRVYPASMRMHSKSTQRKLASHKKTSSGKVSRRSFFTIAKRNNLEERKKRSVIRKRIATNSSHYTSPHYSFVLIWNSLFLSQLLYITRVSLRSLLQSMNFQSIMLNNLPRTKLVLSRETLTRNCLAKQTP